MAIASLIFSIIAIILSFIPFVNIVSIACAIIAISTGIGSIIEKNKKNKALGVAGLCVGLIALFIAIIISLVFGVGLLTYLYESSSAPDADILNDFYENFNYDSYDYDTDYDELYQFNNQNIF